MFCGLYFPPPFGVLMLERLILLLYWPHTSALVAYDGGTTLGMALSGLFFLTLILFPMLVRWMLAMALSGLFSWA